MKRLLALALATINSRWSDASAVSSCSNISLNYGTAKIADEYWCPVSTNEPMPRQICNSLWHMALRGDFDIQTRLAMPKYDCGDEPPHMVHFCFLEAGKDSAARLKPGKDCVNFVTAASSDEDYFAIPIQNLPSAGPVAIRFLRNGATWLVEVDGVVRATWNESFDFEYFGWYPRRSNHLMQFESLHINSADGCPLTLLQGETQPEFSKCSDECKQLIVNCDRGEIRFQDCLGICTRHRCSPWLTILASSGAVLWSLLLGWVTFGGARLLCAPRAVSLTMGVAVTTVMLICGVLLPFVSTYPFACAEVRVEDTALIGHVYPLMILGAGGSLAGFAVSVTQWRQWRKPLGQSSSVYFILAGVFNAFGVSGSLFSSCYRSDFSGLGRQLVTVWAIGSVVSNVVLQDLIIKRTSLINKSASLKRLRVLFWAEVILVGILFVGVVIAETLRRELADVIFHALFVLSGLAIFSIFVCDLVFTASACLIFHRALQSFDDHQSRAGVDLQHQHARLTASDLARLNTVLILASMITTSLFYASMLANLICRLLDTHMATSLSIFYACWLLDSLSNDVCVIFVGFGPIAESLTVIASPTSAHADSPHGPGIAVVAADTIGSSVPSHVDTELSGQASL